ncbi:MAG TPA: hypothetical protein VGP06_19130 [Janthinobacterium sp.]|jgi:hypothetical protein|nr:hypothetical protein [Janthinobacterium sp.]
MLTLSQKLSLSLTLGVAAAAFAAGAQADDTPSMDHEAPNQVKTAAAQSRWISVSKGDVVKFTQNGKSYTLRLDDSPNSKNFDLSQLSPQDADLKGVHLVVTPDAVDSN